VSEIIREKLTRCLGAELPYELTVEIERYEELENITKIYAIIWTERPSQKNIIIGTEGDVLKKVGTDARKDIERLIGQKVYLQLWVKVKKGWSDDERALQSLGFLDYSNTENITS
jgi:GTP-binding protein Era